MIPIVTSQAIALSKAKQSRAKPAPATPELAQPAATGPAEATAAARPGLLRRILDALVPPRPRRTGVSRRIED
jgi:hypothetical protein